MYSWGDIDKVKKNLWKKLHTVKSTLKDGVTNLAQIISTHTNKAVATVQRQLPANVNHYLNKIQIPTLMEDNQLVLTNSDGPEDH